MDIRRKEIKDAMAQILREETAYLLEKWSHYEEMDKLTDYIYQKINDSVSKASEETIVKERLYKRLGITEIEILGQALTLYAYVYRATDEEAARYAIDYCEEYGYVSNDCKTMVVTVYTIMDEILETESNRTIVYELKHLLQLLKKKENSIDYGKMENLAYTHMTDILGNRIFQKTEDVNIAWLYYYSMPEEQDAFMEEYYKELCHLQSLNLKDKTGTAEKLRDFEQLIKWYNSNKEQPEVMEAVNAYRLAGMAKVNFETMIKKGHDRFVRKMRNIEKHFQTNTKYLNEHMYFHGIHTKTGSLRHINFRKPK